MVLLVWSSRAFGGAPDATALTTAWEAEHAAIERLGSIPVSLSGGDFVDLATGEPVVHRVDTAAGAFAAGAVWVSVPLGIAWVAIQDAKDRPIGHQITHTWLPGETEGRRQVYMRLDLPWPLADRQWVSDLVNNRALHAATDGRVWQRRWTLGDPKLAPNADPSAVWVEENQGAWTLVPVGEGTLCVLTIRSVIGGSVPADIAQSWANSVLKRTLRTFAEMAPGTVEHYGAAHEAIVAPDGTVVPRGPPRRGEGQ